MVIEVSVLPSERKDFKREALELFETLEISFSGNMAEVYYPEIYSIGEQSLIEKSTFKKEFNIFLQSFRNNQFNRGKL